MPDKQTVVGHIKQTLSAFFGPGDTFEIRALEVPSGNGFSKTFSGFFNCIESAAEEAYRVDQQNPFGVYFTPNPVDGALIARCSNRLKPQVGKHDLAAKDVDVVARNWFLVDCDPKRPAGISATSDEHERAVGRAREICKFLAGLGWPAPIAGDSGNGAHLCYRIRLPNDQTSLAMVEACLHSIAGKFSDDQVDVDIKVGNAARIWKLYGTMARKGDSTEQRPHRRACLLSVPASVDVVPVEKLRELAGSAPKPETLKPSKMAGKDVVSRARAYLEKVPPAIAGTGGDEATFKAAALLTVDFGLSEQDALPILQEWNLRCSPPWSDSDLLKKLRSAAKSGKHIQGTKAEELAKKTKTTDADFLLHLVLEKVDLFKSDGQAWASFWAGNSLVNAPVRSSCFKAWIRMIALNELKRAIGDETATKVAQTAESVALFGDDQTKEETLFVRVGSKDGKVYFDLADELWRAVEIDRDGWRIITNPPVKFRRARGMKPLPCPVEGGSIEELRPLINASCDEVWTLAVAWLVGSLHPTGPYPILILQGEQGTAKSTTSKLLRDLIDPSKASLRTVPREPKDILIAANNGLVVAFDNLSGLPDWLSDLFCRISTGGGFSTRELYTDSEEVIIDVRRPQILNGIDDVAHRADLRDRSLILNLDPIPEHKRREERDVLAEYEQLRPRILGALFAAVSTALKFAGSTRAANLPRMADFASWVAGAEPALPWEPGRFLSVYREASQTAVVSALEGSPVAMAIQSLIARRAVWNGLTSELLEELGNIAGEETKNKKGWPKDTRYFGKVLKRLAPELRRVGIDIKENGHSRNGTTVLITRCDKACDIVTRDDSSCHASCHAIESAPEADLSGGCDIVTRDSPPFRGKEKIESTPKVRENHVTDVTTSQPASNQVFPRDKDRDMNNSLMSHENGGWGEI